MIIKKIKANDPEYVKLRSMWHEVFGDELSYIDTLYSALDAEGYVGYAEGENRTGSEVAKSGADANDKIVTSLTIYEIGEFEGQTVTAIYAVCTDAKARGRGHASALVKSAVADFNASNEIAITSPAEMSLVKFYENLGFESRLYADEQRIELEDEEKFTTDDFDEEEGEFMPSLQTEVEQIGAERYGELREEFLVGHPHIKLSEKMLEFIKSESHEGNGMLLVNGGDAICIVADSNSDELRLMELLVNPRLEMLSSEIVESIATGLAELFETHSVSYRTRATLEGRDYAQLDGGDTTGVKIQSLSSGNAALEGAYFGFPLD